MEPGGAVVFITMPIAVVAIFAILVYGLRQRISGKGWAELASQRGLTLEDNVLFGEIDGIEVEIALIERRRGRHTDVFTQFSARVPEGWTLMEAPGSTLQRTGEDGFDQRMRLEGDPEVWRPLLGQDARRALLRLGAAADLGVREGWLAITTHESVQSVAGLAAGLDAVLDAVRPITLRAALGPRASLAELARHDPEAGVRRRCARQLLEVDDDAARGTAAYLLDDADPAVRAEAARLLGDPAALALAAVDDKLAEPLRIQALAELDPTSEQARPALEAALKERGELAAVALAAVRDHRLAEHGDAAVRLCTDASVATRAVAAEAVVALKRTDAEPGLIATLECDEPARTAALRALATLGGPDAVAPVEVLARPHVVASLRLVAEETLRQLESR